MNKKKKEKFSIVDGEKRGINLFKKVIIPKKGKGVGLVERLPVLKSKSTKSKMVQKKIVTRRDILRRMSRRRALIKIYVKVKAKRGFKPKLKVGSMSRVVRKVRKVDLKVLNKKSVIFKGEERDKLRGLWGIMEGMLMKNGKRQFIEGVINRVRVALRKKFKGSLNLTNFIERAIRNVTVRVGMGKRRVGGRYRWIPISMLKYKAVRQGCKRIKKGMGNRTERSVEERLMNELIDAYNNVGRSINLVNERRKLIKESKSWLKLIR